MKKDVSERRFRADLWYRLNVFPITLPPLRERRDDIPLLVQYYLDLFSKKQGKHITSIPARIIQVMQRYNWPGNVRELANIIERAVISTSGSKLQLAEELKQHNEMETEEFKSFHDMERDYIIKVLEKTNWKISGANSAAEILGLDRSTLRNKMKKLDIRRP
jgi:transcriptional regulator with GAF, ATPase, and Fis domain